MDDSVVGCTLEFDVLEPSEIALQIAVAGPSRETLQVTGADGPIESVEVDRQHLVHAPAGPLTVTYQATVPPRTAVRPVTDLDRIVALRPSRYCPSDRLGGFAAGEFGTAPEVPTIAAWVFQRLFYQGGSSGPSTDAIDTMLSGAGVCRDYAHLVVTLCRASSIPARVAAVYAPGLSPMDFHLVAEAVVDGRWTVWDATRLAPRPTLIRIATGRDAADTALASTLSGSVILNQTEIFAIAGGDLPLDDHQSPVSLAH
ncbi:transglutaminase-like domain-containing protein [Actinoplanes awajinensis]|uniref:transglutaminase-like domain-containing protein n=1 Tax=Actinoplanes awajinensis TaxID=135946 RepID=UPI0018DB5BB3|nr:transglutaminase family protein [Actinoplanes awajinensis]